MTRAARAAGLVLVLVAVASPGCSCERVIGIVDDDAGRDAGRDGGPSADGGRPDAGPPAVPGLRALRIEPADASVIDDGVVPGEIQRFRALGTFDDGEREVTGTVAWSLDLEGRGAIEAGLFTSAGVGARLRVSASAEALEAVASLTVRLEAERVADGTPADVPGAFPRETGADVVGHRDGPQIVYPSHETMFPLNLVRLDHQWRAGDRMDAFELRFDSDLALVRVFTADRHFVTDPDAWAWLARTHAGGSVRMTVRALDDDEPGVVYSSAPITALFADAEVLGQLYYWSTGAQGVMRASLSSATATKFFSPPDEDSVCVSCHTVSRDGRRLAVGYDGERLRQVSVPDRALQIPSAPAERGRDYGWGTYDPGATRLLFADDGRLSLLDAATGDLLREVALPAGAHATHPDWSPDGRFVAVAYSLDDPGGNKDVRGTSLARIPVGADGTFGAPEVLVASTGDDDTLFFPSYSPDSRYIAFVRAVGRSKDNDRAVVLLVAADGTGAPIALTRLNERVRHEDGVTEIGNSMPTWAPSTRPGIFWLALSSTRAYGDVSDGGRDQLWGAAIDPALLPLGDPGYAAFWMPFQQIEEGNHRAFWALDSEMGCPEDVEICDGLDNDCDGIVDDGCCTPSPEVCDDGVDDDCDGIADDGCGCEDAEICGNGVDDDCDTLVDDADEDCLI